MANTKTDFLKLVKVERGVMDWDAPINVNWDLIDAWASQISTKINTSHVVVQALPANPDPNVFYYIPA